MTTTNREPGWIEGTYENISSLCRQCGAENVHNRVTEIGHTDPIDNATVPCHACGQDYQVCGDLINPAFEMLLSDARDAIARKNYMQAVLLASTACEVFFAHVLRVELIFRVDRRDQTTDDDRIAWLNDTAASLEKKTKRLAFKDMRGIAMKVLVDEVRPDKLAATVAHIQALAKGTRVSDTEIQDKPFSPRVVQALLQLNRATLNQLRNKVVHKNAFRPTRTETEEAVKTVYEAIFQLSHELRLGNDNFHLNESPDDASRPVMGRTAQ